MAEQALQQLNISRNELLAMPDPLATVSSAVRDNLIFTSDRFVRDIRATYDSTLVYDSGKKIWATVAATNSRGSRAVLLLQLITWYRWCIIAAESSSR